MFFRDELLSWSWRRPLGMPLAPVVGGGNMNPVDFKQKITTNVDHVIERINGIAPQYVCEEVSLMKICCEYFEHPNYEYSLYARKRNFLWLLCMGEQNS